MLHRSYHVRLHGLVNGTVLWLLYTMGHKVMFCARRT
jgi:hypothetical protein